MVFVQRAITLQPALTGKTHILPVLECDEFDDYVSPSVTTGRQSVSHSDSSQATFTSEDEDASDYRGLCVNCDNRRTCAYPKPEGGIWHCAEYQ